MIDRERLIVRQEGVLLQLAGEQGDEYAGLVARCVIDGLANALIRIEGREEAAKMAFALADRLVSGVKSPTQWPPNPADEVKVVNALPPPKLPVTKSASFFDVVILAWWEFLAGVLVGFVVGLRL